MAKLMGVVSVVAGLKQERDNLKQQIDRLDAALAALGGMNGSSSSSLGRPKRVMSVAARRRIAAAQRARWAKVRASKGKQ